MDGRRSIVYAGRLVREKGVRELVAAFGALTAADVGLIIVGDGPDRATLETAARGLASGHRIRFVGAVPNTRVGAYLRHADLVVVPSWYEERGRVLLEAMAVGTPVVATRTGGIPATVQDGLTGLLVPPRDPGRLAAAIDRVLGDDGLAACDGRGRPGNGVRTRDRRVGGRDAGRLRGRPWVASPSDAEPRSGW